mmetsp:Transcript_10107/g.11515  ORF Transcript_10107/g.11515 Transcript_10107/m.11515 type:complete len:341 (+) Transcript_10107:1-1023(+)
MSGVEPTSVVVHPLVLLSVVDHFNRVVPPEDRVARGSRPKKRVVGVLLGSVERDGTVDITNSFAVPFEEEERSGIWYLDHNYLATMFAMFKKVNAKEHVVGWYSTGPKIRTIDLDIHQVMQRFAVNGKPAFVIIDVEPTDLGIPTKGYVAVEEVSEDGTETRQAFQHKPTSIEALEAEEVGVEHLLRDVKDSSIGSLSTSITSKVAALRSLVNHLSEMREYLDNVAEGVLPMNHRIVGQLQDMFNLLPNLNVESLVRSFAVKSNDMMLAVYLSSIIRSVLALHNLINNKISNKEAEQKAAEEAAKEEQDKEDVKEFLDEHKKEAADDKAGAAKDAMDESK